MTLKWRAVGFLAVIVVAFVAMVDVHRETLTNGGGRPAETRLVIHWRWN
jgi:hypothetical protein